MTEPSVCRPCIDGTHAECELKACGCLVCEGERIGDAVVGEPGEIRWPIPDRLEPKPWVP